MARFPWSQSWLRSSSAKTRLGDLESAGMRVAHRWATYDVPSEPLRAEVVPSRIDVAGFRDFVARAGYESMDYWRGGKDPGGTEKWLEHFVSLELLEPRPGEVLIDIASCTSPFPEVAERFHGVQAFRQDLSYPEGVHGRRIGGDASHLDLPDEFADLLTLHCSFEHFEGDRDQAFLREAERILKPGGRLCILPLYTSETYSIQTDLAAWKRRVPEIEGDALICVADGWGEVHGRFYDARRFDERVAGSAGSMEVRILRVENFTEAAPDCYLKLAALLRKPAA